MKQSEEIKTIKKRNLAINLSDADVERICNKAGAVGLSVSSLIENFIGDLVNGTYSNGSDERDTAQNWFDRCWFGMFPEKSLLSFLIEDYCYDPKDFIELLDDIANIEIDIEECKENLNEHGNYDDEEMEVFKITLEEYNIEYNEIIDCFKNIHPEATIATELEVIRQWLNEKAELVKEVKEPIKKV